MMSSAKLLLFVLAFGLLISNTQSAKPEDAYSDGMSPPPACTDCSICQYPCNPQPPPPAGGYGGPPPPAAPLLNCPPAAALTPPVMPYKYYPYGKNSASSALPRIMYLVLVLLLPFLFVLRDF